jgi:hypothetical protein
MAGHLVHTGGAVLAALTIAAGGAGTAGATPWVVDELWQGVAPSCSIISGQVADWVPCYRSGFNNSGFLGDYKGNLQGPREAAPGAEVVFYAQVFAQEPAYDVASPEANVDVTSITFHAPKGFDFVDVKVGGYISVPFGQGVSRALDGTVAVDPATGDVTVTAPAGGWALIPGQNGGKFEGGNVTARFTYKAPETDVGGTVGMTFTGTSVPASDGWVASDSTRVMPGFLGTGSAGS